MSEEAPFTTLAVERAFENPYFPIDRHRVQLPSGRKADWFVVAASDVVVVVPILEDGRVLGLRSWKYGARRWIVEFPAGMIDAGETPKEAAARELAEETGYQAAQPLIAMGTAFGNPTGSSARHHMFLARGCQQVAPPAPEDSEVIEPIFFKNLQAAQQELTDPNSEHAATSGAMCALLFAISQAQNR